MSFNRKEKFMIAGGSYLVAAAGFSPLIVKDMAKEHKSFQEFFPVFLWRVALFPYYQTLFRWKRQA